MQRRRVTAQILSFALHALALVALSFNPSHPRPKHHAAAASAPAIEVVEIAPAAPRVKQPESFVLSNDDLQIDLGAGATTVMLSQFAFDLEPIARHARALFPFLADAFLPQLAQVSNSASYARRGVMNPLESASNDQAPKLKLTEGETQAVLDEAWSRRHRWRAFETIAKLAGKYSATEGSLPSVFKDYVAQNGLQPYTDTTVRDPRIWALLGIAADHRDFINFIDAYAVDHPSTKATTELLFLLDTLAQASQDTLTALLDTDPQGDMRWTQEVNPAAYQALVTIRSYYVDELNRRGLNTRAALTERYAVVRLKILSTILETTPQSYRSADARFLIGAICWKRGLRVDAQRIWRQMEPDSTDRYAIASAAILETLANAELTRNRSRVDQILDAERARWVTFSYDRLRQFGYRFDTY